MPHYEVTCEFVERKSVVVEADNEAMAEYKAAKLAQGKARVLSVEETEPERCEICRTTENVRICPIMTGDRFGKPPEHPVCGDCVRAWSEGAGTTPEEILAFRGLL